MSFLNPAAFWGLAALLIPLAIHFWHRKKGRLVRWAAMQWLPEHTTLASRGLQLDDVPLLMLRWLLLTLFVFLLARPVFDLLKKGKTGKAVHLVQRDKFLVENFRFELEKALRKGESVRWIDAESTPLKALETTQQRASIDALQSAIGVAMEQGDSLQLYLCKKDDLLGLPEILIPGPFKIHWSESDGRINKTRSGFAPGDGSLIVPGNNGGLLTVTKENSQGVKAIHNGPVLVRIDYRDSTSVATLKAALLALKDVYQLPFEWWKKGDREADIFFSGEIPRVLEPSKLYFLSGVAEKSNHVHRLELPLTIQASDLVSQGLLPEWLGERILQYYGVMNELVDISPSQLAARFKTIALKTNQTAASSLNPWLLVGLLLLVCLERSYVFYRKTASHG